MTTETTTAHFQSKWGYHACSRETYKQIKRIRHLIEKCKSRNNQFRWWDRKAPQNRIIKTYTDPGTYTSTQMPEPKIFDLFYQKQEMEMSQWQRKACGYHPEQFRYQIVETPEMKRFMKTYVAARHPYPTVEAVTPMLHTPEEIAQILLQLEAYING